MEAKGNELFYKNAIIRQTNNLKANNEDEEIVFQIIEFLKDKELTVDRSKRVLKDARTILPLITKL